MARETEQLVVSLEARIRDFERNFQRAGRTANDNFSRIEKRAKQSGDRLEKSLGGAASRVGSVLKTFGTGFAGGILGGLTVGGLQQLARGIGNVANSVAMIGSQAKMAGLTIKAFQELGYVAEQSRISIDTLADGMKELQLRADEFVTTGSGSGADAFQRLGYSAEDLREKLKDPSALLVDIIARMEQLDKAAQIRVADEIFGGSAGERFVELLDKGAVGIRKMIDEANAFGLVLSDDVIAQADEIDRKFNLISRTIGTRMKGAIVSVAGELTSFMDKMKDMEERQSTTLTGQLADIGKRRMEIENEILKLRGNKGTTIGGTLFGPAFDKQIETLQRESADLAETEKRILDVLSERDKRTADAVTDAVPDITKLNTTAKDTKDAADRGKKGLDSYADAVRALKKEIPELAEELALLDARTKIDTAYRAAIQQARTVGEANQAYALRQQALAAVGRETPSRTGSVSDDTDQAKEKARQQIEAYSSIVASAQEFIAYQQQEATAIGMAADAAAAYRYEQDMLNQAKRDGLNLSADERQEIAQYAQGMAHAEKATRQLAQTQEQAAEISQFFGEQAVDALTGLATGSMTAMDALRQLLATLIRLLLQAALLGEGPLAGSLKGTGGLFGEIGRQFSPGTSAPAIAPDPVQLIAQGEEQTFAAPLGTVERAPLALVQDAMQQTVEGLRGTLGPEGIAKAVQPTMQDAATNFASTITLSPKEITDLKKTLMTEWVTGQGDMQGKGIIDTILNRRASGKWGDTVADVVNARKQFSDVNGPPAWKHGRTSVDDLSVNDPRYARASALVDEYLPQRAAGAPSSVGDHLNYANRAHSTPNNWTWIDRLQGPKYGAHQHGTTPDLERFRPGEFGIAMQGQPGLDMTATGSITDSAQQQAQAIQQQVEAQRELAQQMAATQQATQAMQQPLQGVGQAATQVVPNLGGLGQGLSSLMQPLAQAPGATGAFSQALMQMIQQMTAQKGIGLLGGVLGFADGGHVSGPGTSTSDSIPAMLSDGEFVVNAKSTRKHRAVLEAINAGKAPMLASGGIVSRNAFSNSYSPTLNISVAGSGNARQDSRLADRIADRVNDTLPQDPFRRSEGQKLAQLGTDLRSKGGRNS